MTDEDFFGSLRRKAELAAERLEANDGATVAIKKAKEQFLLDFNDKALNVISDALGVAARALSTSDRKVTAVVTPGGAKDRFRIKLTVYVDRTRAYLEFLADEERMRVRLRYSKFDTSDAEGVDRATIEEETGPDLAVLTLNEITSDTIKRHVASFAERALG